jgi:hypothetical protein
MCQLADRSHTRFRQSIRQKGADRKRRVLKILGSALAGDHNLL